MHGPAPARALKAALAPRNALRHGLSLSVCSDPALCEEVEALAREIAGTGANTEIQELARRIAEAQIDLRRVRYARHRVLSDALSDPYYDSRKNELDKLAFIGSLGRPNAPDIPMAVLEKYLTSTPKGPQKFAIILSQEAKRLLAMNRYEQRALLRRNIAIGSFDYARLTPKVATLFNTIYGDSFGRTKPK